jgi:PPM family protein phosphatase
MEETTAEYSVDQLAPAQVLRVKALITLAAKTDLGRRRENNEDKYEFYIPEDDARLASRGQVFIVCDGMGGHAAGQFASELTVKTFIDVYYSHPAESAEVAMTAAVVAANRFVTDVGRTVPERKGMGTTLSALVLLQEKAYTVQVGDSRIYRLRNGEMLMLTHDHTWVDDAVRAGLITAAEAEDHPYKHVLTRAIGGDADVKPDISSDDMQVGDIYLLCSDGLINHVSDDTIGEVLRTKAPSEAAWNLVGQALQGGGSDNTTVQIIRIDALIRPEA